MPAPRQAVVSQPRRQHSQHRARGDRRIARIVRCRGDRHRLQRGQQSVRSELRPHRRRGASQRCCADRLDQLPLARRVDPRRHRQQRLVHLQQRHFAAEGGQWCVPRCVHRRLARLHRAGALLVRFRRDPLSANRGSRFCRLHLAVDHVPVRRAVPETDDRWWTDRQPVHATRRQHPTRRPSALYGSQRT